MSSTRQTEPTKQLLVYAVQSTQVCPAIAVLPSRTPGAWQQHIRWHPLESSCVYAARRLNTMLRDTRSLRPASKNKQLRRKRAPGVFHHQWVKIRQRGPSEHTNPAVCLLRDGKKQTARPKVVCGKEAGWVVACGVCVYVLLKRKKQKARPKGVTGVCVYVVIFY